MKKSYLKILALLIIIIAIFFVFAQKKEVTEAPEPVTMSAMDVNEYNKRRESAISFPVNETTVSCEESGISFTIPSGFEKKTDTQLCEFTKSYGTDIDAAFFVSRIDKPIENAFYYFDLVSDSWYGAYENGEFVNNIYTPALYLEKYNNPKGLSFYVYGGGDAGYGQQNYILPLKDKSTWVKITIWSDSEFMVSEEYEKNTENYTTDRILLLDSIMIDHY